MPARTISPLDGYPSTRQITDAEDCLAYEISFRAPTPGCIRLTDALLDAWGTALVVLFGAVALRTDFDLHTMAIGGGAGAAAYFGVSLALKFVLQRKTKLTLSVGQVKTYPFPFWSRRYDRKNGGFAMFTHDLLVHEQRAHELAQAEAAHRGKVLRKKPLFGDSFHVVFFNGDQRVDVATIYGTKKANAVIRRLQYLDAALDHVARSGNGKVGGSDANWTNDPGGL